MSKKDLNQRISYMQAKREEVGRIIDVLKEAVERGADVVLREYEDLDREYAINIGIDIAEERRV